jgi:hypothetical protein
MQIEMMIQLTSQSSGQSSLFADQEVEDIE